VLAVLLSNEEATVLGQLAGLAVIFSWVFLASLLVWFILKKTAGIRVSQQQEYEGVDLHECGLEAYPEFTKAAD
jgi:ammonium transporter, Amt family